MKISPHLMRIFLCLTVATTAAMSTGCESSISCGDGTRMVNGVCTPDPLDEGDIGVTDTSPDAGVDVVEDVVTDSGDTGADAGSDTSNDPDTGSDAATDSQTDADAGTDTETDTDTGVEPPSERLETSESRRPEVRDVEVLDTDLTVPDGLALYVGMAVEVRATLLVGGEPFRSELYFGLESQDGANSCILGALDVQHQPDAYVRAREVVGDSPTFADLRPCDEFFECEGDARCMDVGALLSRDNPVYRCVEPGTEDGLASGLVLPHDIVGSATSVLELSGEFIMEPHCDVMAGVANANVFTTFDPFGRTDIPGREAPNPPEAPFFETAGEYFRDGRLHYTECGPQDEPGVAGCETGRTVDSFEGIDFGVSDLTIDSSVVSLAPPEGIETGEYDIGAWLEHRVIGATVDDAAALAAEEVTFGFELYPVRGSLNVDELPDGVDPNLAPLPLLILTEDEFDGEPFISPVETLTTTGLRWESPTSTFFPLSLDSFVRDIVTSGEWQYFDQFVMRVCAHPETLSEPEVDGLGLANNCRELGFLLDRAVIVRGGGGGACDDRTEREAQIADLRAEAEYLYGQSEVFNYYHLPMPTAPVSCSDTCELANNGVCDDLTQATAADGVRYRPCAFGTDCSDCGDWDGAGRVLPSWGHVQRLHPAIHFNLSNWIPGYALDDIEHWVGTLDFVSNQLGAVRSVSTDGSEIDSSDATADVDAAGLGMMRAMETHCEPFFGSRHVRTYDRPEHLPELCADAVGIYSRYTGRHYYTCDLTIEFRRSYIEEILPWLGDDYFTADLVGHGYTRHWQNPGFGDERLYWDFGGFHDWFRAEFDAFNGAGAFDSSVWATARPADHWTSWEEPIWKMATCHDRWLRPLERFETADGGGRTAVPEDLIMHEIISGLERADALIAQANAVHSQMFADGCFDMAGPPPRMAVSIPTGSIIPELVQDWESGEAGGLRLEAQAGILNEINADPNSDGSSDFEIVLGPAAHVLLAANGGALSAFGIENIFAVGSVVHITSGIAGSYQETYLEALTVDLYNHTFEIPSEWELPDPPEFSKEYEKCQRYFVKVTFVTVCGSVGGTMGLEVTAGISGGLQLDRPAIVGALTGTVRPFVSVAASASVSISVWVGDVGARVNVDPVVEVGFPATATLSYDLGFADGDTGSSDPIYRWDWRTMNWSLQPEIGINMDLEALSGDVGLFFEPLDKLQGFPFYVPSWEHTLFEWTGIVRDYELWGWTGPEWSGSFSF